MENILIFIKHHFSFLWRIIEKVNSSIFSLLYRRRLLRTLPEVLAGVQEKPFRVRILDKNDAVSLHQLINSQPPEDVKYFNPHGTDLKSISGVFRNTSFLPMGIFEGHKLIGYFFLRFFANGKCFVGRLTDREYRGKGIGRIMNKIMYETAWRMKFRCLSTISKNNVLVMRAHEKNQSLKVLKELKNNYLLVEFVRIQNH